MHIILDLEIVLESVRVYVFYLPWCPLSYIFLLNSNFDFLVFCFVFILVGFVLSW